MHSRRRNVWREWPAPNLWVRSRHLPTMQGKAVRQCQTKSLLLLPHIIRWSSLSDSSTAVPYHKWEKQRCDGSLCMSMPLCLILQTSLCSPPLSLNWSILTISGLWSRCCNCRICGFNYKRHSRTGCHDRWDSGSTIPDLPGRHGELHPLYQSFLPSEQPISEVYMARERTNSCRFSWRFCG